MRALPSLFRVSIIILYSCFLTGCAWLMQPEATSPTPIQNKLIAQNLPGAQAQPNLYRLSVGERDIWTTQLFQPREYCGHDPIAHMRAVCGVKQGYLYHIGSQVEHKCGYNYYIIICMN